MIVVCTNAAVLRLRTTLQPRGPAAAIVLTDEQVATIAGTAKTPPVRVTVNGNTFAGRVGRMGGESLVGLSRAVRDAAGVQAGDDVDVTIVLDEGPRPIDLPEELTTALAGNDDARAAFDDLAPSRRKELARRIAEAKRPETRQRRLAEVMESLHAAALPRGAAPSGAAVPPLA